MEKTDIILDKIKEIFSARHETHGKSDVCFKKISDLWSVYLEKNISEQDVCNLMCLFKLARLSSKKSQDSALDLAGYAVLVNTFNLDS